MIQPTNSTCYNLSCDNGECVSDSYRCDGHDDCGDNSDENNCSTYSLSFFAQTKQTYFLGVIQPTSSTCYNFSCDNGECVPDSYRCNGHDDCGDNSDEINCKF